MTGPVTTVDILGPAHGGTGVARVDGQVVLFVVPCPVRKGYRFTSTTERQASVFSLPP